MTNLIKLVQNLENDNAYADLSMKQLLKELKTATRLAERWLDDNIDPDTFDIAIADIIRLATVFADEYRRSY